MDKRPRHRTIGTLRRQDHRTRRLLAILVAVGIGLAALFGLSYSVARLDTRNFDNQEQTPPASPSAPDSGPDSEPQHSQLDP